MNFASKLIAIALFSASATVVLAEGYSGPSADNATAASAYKGPSTVPAMTIRQLAEKGVDDQYVRLTGKIVRHTGGKNYILADATGEMPVEIKDKYFPPNQTLDATTTVELTGQYDKSRFGTSELEVSLIKIVK